MKSMVFYLSFRLCLLAVLWLACQPSLISANEPFQFSNAPGYSLPLVGHWNLGETPDGFTPKYQMKLIEDGHRILPWFWMPQFDVSVKHPYWIEYYEPAIRNAARLKLPISFVGTQWEIWLSSYQEYLKLPFAENPNVVMSNGTIQQLVSPFGGIEAWRDLGKRWTQTAWMRRLQELYPDPPYVLFVSNNEHPKLEWMKVEEDARYLARYGKGRDDDFKRLVAGDSWIERYRALQDGLRQGLTNELWHNRARFLAYNAFGPAHFARWEGWKEHSLYTQGRIDPWALAWEGGSAPYYVFNWSAITDFTVYSPQVEAMNWVFMQNEARRLSPDFVFELSTWNGNEPGLPDDKLVYYRKLGQNYHPERYAGYVKFGMWLTRPQLIRDFRSYRASVADFESYFKSILDAVDRVYDNAVLRGFWQKGRLVPNRAFPHPYQTDVPPEYKNVDRWFLLNTSVDPPRPWSLATPLPVFSLALSQGRAPQRRWLVYAHAPTGVRDEVEITLPEYRAIKVKVPVEGAYYLVDESQRRVTEVK
jgi:hypothetical protein